MSLVDANPSQAEQPPVDILTVTAVASMASLVLVGGLALWLALAKRRQRART
jgi:hypothetical protein